MIMKGARCCIYWAMIIRRRRHPYDNVMASNRRGQPMSPRESQPAALSSSSIMISLTNPEMMRKMSHRHRPLPAASPNVAVLRKNNRICYLENRHYRANEMVRRRSEMKRCRVLADAMRAMAEVINWMSVSWRKFNILSIKISWVKCCSAASHDKVSFIEASRRSRALTAHSSVSTQK